MNNNELTNKYNLTAKDIAVIEDHLHNSPERNGDLSSSMIIYSLKFLSLHTSIYTQEGLINYSEMLTSMQKS